MSTPELKLTDKLWFAMHDKIKIGGGSFLAAKPRGIGLAAALLAELLMLGSLLLDEDGVLFAQWVWRGQKEVPLAANDKHGLQPTPFVPRTPEREPALDPIIDLVVAEEQPYNVRDWITFLAQGRDQGGCRAEELVLTRLERTGYVMLQVRTRLLRRPVERMVPKDSAYSGNPANRISTALHRGQQLDHCDLVLADLIVETGLHQHALATLAPAEYAALSEQLKDLPRPLRDLLHATQAAIGDAAITRR